MGAKPKFDPNQPYEPVAAKPKFDPSQPYEAAGSEGSMLDAPILGTTPRGLIKGTLNALPTAGALAGGTVGGLIGGTAGGIGAIPAGIAGAGVGGVGGDTLKRLGEQYLLGEKAPTREDFYSDQAKAGIEGVGNQMLGESITAGAKALKDSKLGQKVAEKGGKAISKLASSFSGVPQEEIETYAKNADEINTMAKGADNDSQVMADNLRQKLNGKIQATRKALNSQIGTTLEARSGETIDPTPAIDELEKQAAKINSKLRPEDADEIKEIITKVKSLGEETSGKIGLKDAHDLKEYLQDIASGAYQKGGQIFQPGDKTSRAAKSAAALIRTGVNEAAPEVASANNQLAKLRSIESVMNRNILAEGKTAAPLYAAGSGGNPANAKALERLGDVTGEDMLGEAQKLAAARTFGKPSLLPVDTTGKSLTRMGAAGVGGYLVGGLPGAIAAEGLASPAMLKAGIMGGRAGGRLGSGLLASPAASGLLLRKGLMRERAN